MNSNVFLKIKDSNENYKAGKCSHQLRYIEEYVDPTSCQRNRTAEFGSPAAIRDTFIGFQKYLYE